MSPRPRRVSGKTALSAIGIGLAGVAIVAAVWSIRAAAVPKAEVDHLSWDLGVIESSEQLGHTFIIHNVGRAPLRLMPGPKLCACTVTGLPDEPIPPGGQAEVKMGFTAAAKRDELKPGHFSKAIRVLTNDPERADILLELTATVNRRVAALPAQLTLTIDSSKPSSQRSAETWIYSECWKRFELSAAKVSRKGLQWRIEPATEKKLNELKALSGYHVFVTMPPEMPDGRFAEWIEFAAKPAAGTDEAAACRLEIHGRVEGRLEFFGPKIVGRNVLRLGSLQQGEPARETVLMKINDQRRQLAVEQIEVEPAFLRARIVPYAAGPKPIGLYRVEVAIPADAPSGAFLGTHCGIVRLKTDHPRLPIIELRVDFAVAGRSENAGLAQSQ
jgi:hypothetical protein